MKSLEELKVQYKFDAIDGRDVSRLVDFIPEEQLKDFGVTLKAEYVGKHQPIPFTKENVLKRLEEDVAFGFEKALNQRGISSSLMYGVVSMWNFILDEGLQDFEEYAQYGLPLFKATAVKYGFPNPIGDDSGEEDKYSSE